MRLNIHLNEKTSSGRGLTIFDLDETLMRTFAKINVYRGNDLVRSLSNREFNTYKLKPGERFDFKEFKDAELFYKTSEPIRKNIEKLIAITKNATKVGSKVILLTARANLDNKEMFLDTFRKYGVPIDKIYVERAGNREGTIHIVKKQIVTEYLSTGEFRRVRLYDDFLKNCQEFLTLQDDMPLEIEEKIREKWDVPDDEPVVEFFAYLVNADGVTKRIYG